MISDAKGIHRPWIGFTFIPTPFTVFSIDIIIIIIIVAMLEYSRYRLNCILLTSNEYGNDSKGYTKRKKVNATIPIAFALLTAYIGAISLARPFTRVLRSLDHTA
jgi:hypothetical protein